VAGEGLPDLLSQEQYVVNPPPLTDASAPLYTFRKNFPGASRPAGCGTVGARFFRPYICKPFEIEKPDIENRVAGPPDASM
jgi:hypothetical protein